MCYTRNAVSKPTKGTTVSTATKDQAATLLEGISAQFQARLAELRPQADEFATLNRAWEALSGVENDTATVSPRIVARGRTARKATPGQAKIAQRAGNRRGRPAGSGKRSQEVLALVGKNPGITISELAAHMKIQPNYLYRVVPDMVKSGTVIKDGHGFTVA